MCLMSILKPVCVYPPNPAHVISSSAIIFISFTFLQYSTFHNLEFGHKPTIKQIISHSTLIITEMSMNEDRSTVDKRYMQVNMVFRQLVSL